MSWQSLVRSRSTSLPISTSLQAATSSCTAASLFPPTSPCTSPSYSLWGGCNHPCCTWFASRGARCKLQVAVSCKLPFTACRHFVASYHLLHVANYCRLLSAASGRMMQVALHCRLPSAACCLHSHPHRQRPDDPPATCAVVLTVCAAHLAICFCRQQALYSQLPVYDELFSSSLSLSPARRACDHAICKTPLAAASCLPFLQPPTHPPTHPPTQPRRCKRNHPPWHPAWTQTAHQHL